MALGRRFIGADVNPHAVRFTAARLLTDCAWPAERAPQFTFATSDGARALRTTATTPETPDACSTTITAGDLRRALTTAFAGASLEDLDDVLHATTVLPAGMVAGALLEGARTVDDDNIRSIRRLGEPEVAAAFRVGQAVIARKHGVRYTGVITAIRGTRLQVTVTVAPGRRRSIDVPALHACSAAPPRPPERSATNATTEQEGPRLRGGRAATRANHHHEPREHPMMTTDAVLAAAKDLPLDDLRRLARELADHKAATEARAAATAMLSAGRTPRR